jgi:four helix bundle protein
MQNFRTHKAAIAFYKSCKTIRFTGPIKNQFERALLSIPLNLAEGSSRPSRKERKRFYFIALGSLREVQTILSITENESQIQKADELGAMLYRLCHRC